MNFDYEFKGATIYEAPKTPLIKPLPDFLKTNDEIARYIRHDIGITDCVSRCVKSIREKNKLIEKTEKHRIFIACPSYRDVPRYTSDLVEALNDRGVEIDYVHRQLGIVETDHVFVKMITPGMHTEGLRCDECFGFPPMEAIFLKKDRSIGRQLLSDVPRYIEIIEKEKIKEMNATFAKDYLNQLYGAHGIGKSARPTIKNVIFNDPATIVMWSDGTKTVVKAEGEDFDPEKGLAMAISKKNLGNKHDYYNTFKHWIKKYYKEHPQQEKDAEWTVAAKPVDVAYHTLLNIISAKGTKPTKPELEAAIQEAIDFLGEALDK